MSIQWALTEFTSGTGIEVSTTNGKAFPHFIKVCVDKELAEVSLKNIEKLNLFATNSLDFVVSADTFHTFSDPESVILEYLRVIKDYGYLSIIIKKTEANSTLKALKRYVIWHKVEINGMLLIVIRKGVSRDAAPTKVTSKTAIVVRYGAFGDQAQASSVYAGLKKQGYHVTLVTQMPGAVVIKHDPNIDKQIVLEVNQVPNQALGDFFKYLETICDKFVNLCESVEGTFLAMEPRPTFGWSQAARHMVMNGNYVEFQHALAGVPHVPQIKFYSTSEEDNWQRRNVQSTVRL